MTNEETTGYYCDVCAAEADWGECPGCGLNFCDEHGEPEHHGPIDPNTRLQGCESWDFSVDHYGPKVPA